MYWISIHINTESPEAVISTFHIFRFDNVSSHWFSLRAFLWLSAKHNSFDYNHKCRYFATFILPWSWMFLEPQILPSCQYWCIQVCSKAIQIKLGVQDRTTGSVSLRYCSCWTNQWLYLPYNTYLYKMSKWIKGLKRLFIQKFEEHYSKFQLI